jgi:tetratricopeptide (TPR) repeat protein
LDFLVELQRGTKLTPNETRHEALRLFREGSVEQAASMLEGLRAVYVQQKDESQVADVGNDLGVMYYRLGRLKEARGVFEEARSVFEKLGNAKGHARAMGNLAQVMSRAGEKDAAQDNYVRAAELFHQAGEREYEYDTYRALSQMQMKSGRWLESIATYDRALAAKGGSGAFRAFLKIPLKIIGTR